ncbi:hypothetical protein GCM10022285_24900 [Streptomyces tunisiensis]|uniref:Uncharacterized protein n=2 Tax=Streptomyces TaxID=1883 RepID=A0ABP7YB28_9ACTN
MSEHPPDGRVFAMPTHRTTRAPARPTGRAVTLGLTLAVLAGAGWLAGMIYTLITWQL